MHEPFNPEGSDLSSQVDTTHSDPSVTEANVNAMPGFTPEQTSSLQQMLSTTIREAIEPLLGPLGELLSVQGKGSLVGIESEDRQTSSTSHDLTGPQPLKSNQPQAWLKSAKSSAALKVIFKDEPEMDKLCPTRDFFAEKPVSVASPSVSYDRSFTRLPFDAPLGCAHIIDTKRYYLIKSPPPLKMADVVVTILFKFGRDLLHAFLNVNRHRKFSFIRRGPIRNGRGDFSIERSGLTVTCTLHQLGHREERAFDDEETRIQQLGTTRHGKMEFICEMKPWGKWAMTSWSSGDVSLQGSNDKRKIERYAHAFGLYVFESRLWIEGEGVTFEGGASGA